jgi:hypothetical protein
MMRIELFDFNHRRITMKRLFAITLLLLYAAVAASQTPPVRVRGKIEKLDGQVLIVKSREGPSVTIKLNDNFTVAGVVAASLADVAAGKYVGIASLPQADGSQKALEVLIFPDAMRGAGEGHYAWDLMPDSMMTNADVADVASGAQGRTFSLKYKDGEKKVMVPDGIPIVTFVAADRSALTAGASVFIGTQKQPDGSLTAGRVNVGLKGLVPPM